jgi:DNA (cytosine-5)-methyltransferase 1
MMASPVSDSNDIISVNAFADVMGVSKATIRKWEDNGTYIPHTDDSGHKFFYTEELSRVPEIREMIQSNWEEEMLTKPLREYTSIELFAGAGGLALGMEKAGFHHILLNEIDHDACRTLEYNRPKWNVAEQDVRQISFKRYRDNVDFISGGFPCQAFSYAGKQGGFGDMRGTLFFDLARAVDEVRPKVFMGENVRGLAAHDGGKTLKVIRAAIRDLGYTLVEPQVLRAVKYQVPQKRERLFLIAVRNDLSERVKFKWPEPYHRIMTLRDAFFSGVLYPTDVPASAGAKYPPKKQDILAQVPMGGYWRDLPVDVQKDFMGGSYLLEGGKTGMARRLSLDEPSLTLTCSPAQKQTERCHPTETRPLTVREYARIQTFPDEWLFAGSLASQYKQIGNAVPVNLAYAVGRSLIRLFNDIERL